MGSCVSTLMDRRNALNINPHETVQRCRQYGKQDTVVPSTETDTASATYRIAHVANAEYAQVAKDLYNDLNWVQVVEQRCKELGDAPCLAYRNIVRVETRTVVEAGGQERVMDYFHMSPRITLSFREVWQRMNDFSRGLATLGLPARAKVTIYEDTRWEWLASAYGIWLQDMIVTTVYANLGEQALTYALSETESKLIISNGKNVRQLVQLLRARQLHPIIVYLDDIPDDVDCSGFKLMSWTSLLEAGSHYRINNNDSDCSSNSHSNDNSGKISSDSTMKKVLSIRVPQDNDSVALIMYTSGTTGNPKGVVHTHGSIAAGIRSLEQRITDIFRPPRSTDAYCAFLPLAHILEFGLANLNISRGVLVGFGSPRTLTDVYTIPNGDLREYNPTYLIGVPRIFDTIKKAIEAKLPPPGSFKRQIFDRAYESRLAALKDGMDTPFYNDKVFNNVRQMLGRNMAGMLSGGGPLSASTQEFLNVVCGGPLMLQGWGLTETICCGVTQRLGDLKPECAGQIVYGCELRLVDTDSYRHTDQPEPRGEICLRGPFLFKEYYKQPEMTAEVLDKEGWFHTGDIGKMSSSGKLSIIGRIKALAKNAHGEYIALEALESIYGTNNLLIPGGVCVLVDPMKSYVCALGVTDQAKAEKFAKENNIPGTYRDILGSSEFQRLAALSLAATARSVKRRPFEIVKYVRIVDDEWTPQNGLTTPTMKLRRDHIRQRYAQVYDELFSH